MLNNFLLMYVYRVIIESQLRDLLEIEFKKEFLNNHTPQES